MTHGREGAAEQAPMQVWCADPAEAAPLVALLGPVERLERLPETPGDATLLILHPAPVAALAGHLAAGLAPEAAATAWAAETRRLLRLHRAARRRVRLAEISAARAHPRAFQALFGGPGQEAPVETPLSEPTFDPVLGLLAQRLILGDATLNALVDELEAASADLTGGQGLTADNPEAAWRSHAEAGQLRSQVESAGRDRQEADLLKAQNRAMMDELESLARHSQQMQDRLTQTGQGLDSAQAQIATLEAALEALRRRTADKERSLLAAGRMIEEAELRAAGLKTALERAEDKAATLRAELDRITASRSFRLTAPLRRMRALIGGRS